jgi:L-iditol 2-dehydrogenase
MSNHYKCIQFLGPEKFELVQKNKPQLKSGDLLIKVKSTSICGSDMRIFQFGNQRIIEPIVMGHEIAGEVVESRDEAGIFSIGDRVSFGADLPCHGCFHCNLGHFNRCEEHLAFGYQIDGGFAEMLHVPSNIVQNGPIQKFSSNLSFDEAAITEPLACCLNGLEMSFCSKGLTFLILGAGPIGLLLIQLARKLLDSPMVCVVEPSKSRREMALRIGANLTFDSLDPDINTKLKDVVSNRGFHRVFTSNSNATSHLLGLNNLSKGGILNFFGGISENSEKLNISSNFLHYNEFGIVGSHGSNKQQNVKALELIERGIIKTDFLITSKFNLLDISHAFEKAMSGNELKVVINPND